MLTILTSLLILIPFPNKSVFLHVCSISLLKTLSDKEKLLVTSNFSFSNIFYPFVTVFQMTNFRLYQTERSLQTTISSLLKMADSSPKWVENTVGKEEIAGYEQFLIFPRFFFKRSVLQTCKNQGLFQKEL